LNGGEAASAGLPPPMPVLRKLSTIETPPPPSASTDQDSAWKEMLDEYLRAFLKFFFPRIHDEIDWRRGYESLDKELARIRPAHAAGKLFADKLFKVYLKNGKPAWLLIHIELIFDLYRRKFSRAKIINLFRFFDWVMTLPPEMEEKLRQDVYEFEEKNKMPYVTSFERFAKQEGLEQGMEKGKRTMTLQLLELQIGELTDRLQKRLSRLSIEQIEQLAGALLKFKSKADLLAWLKSQTITSRPKAATNGGAHAQSS
jgi:hypothetical protein